MEVHGNWYNRVAREIGIFQGSLNKKEAKKYKLDFLLKIAGRVDEFSGTCGECQLFQQDISQLIQDLSLLIQMPSKEGLKKYRRSTGSITKHLQKVHKLVTKGYYVGICMAIGTGIGVALNAALDIPGIGPALGIGIGLAVGSYLDRKAKQEGRVL